MIFQMTYYQICMYFLIYSFLGWCVEVVYHALKQGKIINRGFLNGPVCPVYGFGMLAIIAMVNELPKNASTNEPNTWFVFIGGMILTTIIEFIAGFLLYHCFHARWWDYSNMPGNIGGYICPLFSVLWGMGCVVVMKLVHPISEHLCNSVISPSYGWWIMLVLYVLYLIDFIATVLTAAGLNKKLKSLDELDKKLRAGSDELSNVLGQSSIKLNDEVQEQKIQATLAKDDLRDAVEESAEDIRTEHSVMKAEKQYQREESIHQKQDNYQKTKKELQKRYEELREDITSHTAFGTGRLLKAFPDMKHRDYDDLVHNLQEYQKKNH